MCFCFYTSNNILLAQSDPIIVTGTGETTPTDDHAQESPLLVIQDLITIRISGKN